MDINLTLEQFENLTKDIVVNSDGSTNKKCPICKNDVIIEQVGSSGLLKCKSKKCLSIDFRGI